MLDKVLSDKGDHSMTGIVLLVGGLKKGERLYSHCVRREKKEYIQFWYIQKNVSKKVHESYWYFVWNGKNISQWETPPVYVKFKGKLKILLPSV